ncbi:MAG: gliding motility-associated C-terminal domain-containing protein [Prevotellaceae bacterium]|nr:gliding motility-associated C-terminal domain-containing protein [Prevotellaceae bacterium]
MKNLKTILFLSFICIALQMQAQTDCLTGTLLFREDFGGNDPADDPIKAGGIPQVIGYSYNPNTAGTGRYSIRKEGQHHSVWTFMDDHTYPNDYTRGYMMQVDGSTDPSGQFYKTQIDELCVGATLYFSLWAASVSPGFPQADLAIVIEDLSGNELIRMPTGLIPTAGGELYSPGIQSSPAACNDWVQYGASFTITNATPSVIFKIINNNTDSGGNDFVIDDIEIRLCMPPVTIDIPSDTLCLNGIMTISSDFTNDGSFTEPLEYRWLKSPTDSLLSQNNWTATGNNAASLKIDGATKADEGWYRLAISGVGGIELENCRAMSDPIFIAVDDGCWATPFAGAENDTIDLNACNSAAITVDVLNNDSSSCVLPNLSLLDNAIYGNNVSISANQLNYTPQFHTGSFEKIDSLRYEISCQGELDTATVYFRYPVQPIEIEESFTNVCYKEGSILEYRVKLTNHCAISRQIGVDFIFDDARFNGRVIDAQQISAGGGAYVSSAGSNATTQRLWIYMPAASWIEVQGRFELQSLTGAPYSEDASLGYVFDSATGYILQWNNKRIPQCIDRVFTVEDCGESISADLWNEDAANYRIVGKNLPASIASISSEGVFSYTAPDVNQIEYDTVEVEIEFIDATILSGKIAVKVLPCINIDKIEATVNTHCDLNPYACNYNGPSILINEVMTTPLEYDGAIFGKQCDELPTTGGGEWVELYNPNPCDSVDISGYFFANSTIDSPHCDGVDTRDIGGGFVLPEGTVVPPSGFCVLRGEFAARVDSGRLIENGGNTVQINLMDHFDRFCLDTDKGNRFWLPNMSGWFGFYNREGEPQDAIFWGETGSDICADCTPCNPEIPGSFMGELAALNDFPEERKNRIRYAYDLTGGHDGVTPKRQPDGSEWFYTTYTDPTQGYCNGDCYHRSDSDCNGTASVEASGGTGSANFEYQWNDPLKQTTPIATGLCEGNYCCTITDLVTGLQRIVCVTVAINEPPIDTMRFSDEICRADLPYPFYGQNFNSSGEYSVRTTCDSVKILTLTVHDAKETLLDESICAGESYEFALTQLTEEGVYRDSLKTSAGCDSVVILTLTVNPTYEITETIWVCEGEDTTPPLPVTYSSIHGCDSVVSFIVYSSTNDTVYIDDYFYEGNSYHFGSQWLSEEGIFEEIFKNRDNCDSVVILNLTIRERDEIPVTIPEGFSPNGDGVNDRFEIKVEDGSPLSDYYPNNHLLIFNRWGNKLYESKPYMNDWDGRNYEGGNLGSDALPSGTYYYLLDLGNGTKIKKGFIFLSK